MAQKQEVAELFFSELKKFNSTNFRTIEHASLEQSNPVIHKAFSSAVTRFFIFKEKNPDVTEIEARMLYFQLKLDMIAAYFAEYPSASPQDYLRPFQLELQKYAKRLRKQEGEDEQ